MKKLINFIQSDKYLHASVCFIVTTTLSTFGVFGLIIGIVASLTLGVYREISKPPFSWPDIKFDAYGILYAIILFILRGIF